MTPQEVIKRFTSSLSLTTLTGTAALDAAIRSATNNFFSSLDDLKTKFLNDIAAVNDGNKFIKDYCDIILRNKDTGAITGSDAGNGKVKTSTSVVEEEGNINDWSAQLAGTTITLSSGLRVVLPSTRRDGTALTDNDLFLMKCLPKWLEAGLALNEESYGLSFSGTSVSTIYVNLYNENDGTLASCGPNGYNSAGKGIDARVNINLHYYSNLDRSNPSGRDLSSGQNNLDRTLAHELNHAIMAANVKQAYNLPAYITEGTAELVHGVDDTRSLVIFASNADLMRQALTSSNWVDYPTVYSGGVKLNAPCYAGGFTLLRYMAKQASTDYTKIFYGTNDDEQFETERNYVKIYAGGGNDSLDNGYRSATARGGDYVLLDGGEGNNLISNFGGDFVTMQSGLGNDTIWNWTGSGTVEAGANAYIVSGAGNDTIWNGGDGAVILTGSGSDSITNNGGSNVSINGGEGDDRIHSSGNNATLTGGEGNDSITNNSGANVLFIHSSGNDTLWGFRADSTLQMNSSYTVTTLTSGNLSVVDNAGEVIIVNGANLSTINIEAPASARNVTLTNGNDNYSNTTDGILIQALAGADTITNTGSNVTIDGGAGDDSLYSSNWSGAVSMNGGEGNDTLIVQSDGNKTLTGGSGSDLFVFHHDNDSRYGTDHITDYATEDKIKFENVAVTDIQMNGDDAVVKANVNTVILQNVAGKTITYIDSDSSTKKIAMLNESNNQHSNSTDGVLIKALGGDDTITNSGSNVTIDGGADNDSLSSSNWSGAVSMNGSAGNDTLYTRSDGNKTLTGGNGSDLFVFHHDTDSRYGTDHITDYEEEDKVHFDNVAVTDIQMEGDDAVVKAGVNSVVLQNVAGKVISYIDSDGSTHTYAAQKTVTLTEGNDNYSNSENKVLIQALGGDDTITNSGSNVTMDGGADNDSLSSGNWSGAVSMNGGAGNDTLYTCSDGKKTLTGGSGADLFVFHHDNDGSYGTDHITDYEEEDKVHFDNVAVTDIQMNGDDAVVKANVNTVILQNVAGKTITYIDSDSSTKKIAMLNESNNQHSNSTDGVLIKALGGDDTITNSGSNVTIDGGADNDSLSSGNWSGAVSMNGGAGNDTLYTCSDGKKTLTGGSGADLFVFHHDNDGSYGTDHITDYEEEDKVHFDNVAVTDIQMNGDDAVVKANVNTVILQNVAGKTITYIDSDGSTKTYAAQKTVTLTEGNDNYSNSENKVLIKSLGGDDTITNSGSNVTMDGGANNDSLSSSNWSGAVSMNGGEGNDTLIVQSDGNKTLTGGSGADLFVFHHDNDSSYGTDHITDYEEEDKVHFDNVAVTDIQMNGDDAVVKANVNTVILQNVAGKTITYIDSDGSTKTYTAQKTVTLTEGNDNYFNSANEVLIKSLGGDDTITNSGSNVTMDGGEGADSINNSNSENVLIEAGVGNDSLYTAGASVTAHGGEGDDYLHNYGGAFIGKSRTNNGAYTSLNGGLGNDTLQSESANNVTLTGGEGSDSIVSEYSSNVTQDGGAGDDTLSSNLDSNVSISGGAGNDSISAKSSNSTLDGGAGNNVISNGGDTVSITSEAGDDMITNRGSNVTINSGAGADSINNNFNGTNVSINAGDGSDTITNELSTAVIINAGTGSDSISNSWGSQSSIDAGEGADTIANEFGNSSTLLGGADNDSITNSHSDYVLMNGGTGADTISNNYGDNASIDGAQGDDYIYSGDSKNVSIMGGLGDDTIVDGSENSRSTIDGGAGNDQISLRSWLGNYSLIKFSGGFDTIYGFDGTDTLQFGDGTDTYSKEILDNNWELTSGDGKVLLMDAVNLNRLNILGKEISWQLEGTTATYGNFITVSGVKSLDGISLKNKIVTVSESSLDKTNVTVSDGYTLALGSDVFAPAPVSADYKDGVYTTEGTTAGYSLSDDKKSISYSAATTKTFEFEGIADGANASNFYLSGNTMTIGKAAVQTNGTPVKILTDGYTLKLGKGMGESESVAASYADGVYTSKGTTAGYTLSSDKKSVSYSAATTKTFEFEGIADGANASNFYLSGNTMTIGKAAVQTNGTPVKILTDGYTLKLGKGMGESESVAASYADGVYTTKGTTAGYTLSSDKKSVSYSSATTKDFKFSGVADEATADNFYLRGSEITIGKAAVQTDGTPVKLLTNGYTLKLGRGMGESESVAASYADGVYTTKGTTAGYSLSSDKKSISCVAGTSKEIKFSGVADEATASNFYLSGNTITVGKAAVQTNGTPVKLLTNGYTLKLGKGMGESESVAANYANGVYTTKGTTAGYSLSSDKKSISCVAGTSKEIKFSGVADEATASNFYLSGNTITVGKAAVKTDGTPVKLLTDGYTLKLGRGMGESESIAASYADGVYTTKGTTAGYSLSSDKKSISYVAGTSKEIKFSGIANGATADNFYLSGKTITIGKAAVKTDGTPVKLLTDGYTLKLGKGMTASEVSEETFSNGVYTFGGQTEGYSLSSDKKSISYTEATDEALTLSGLASKPATPVNKVVTLEVENFSRNISVADNDGGFTFSIAAGNYSGKTFTGSMDADIISNAGSKIKINAGMGNDSIKSSGTDSTLDGGMGNDTIAGSAGADTLLGDMGNDILWGGAGNDSLDGGMGNNTLWGGAGNDTLTGDMGNDTFIYRPNEGTDIITDYSAGDMLKILKADGAQGTFNDSSFSGSNLTLTIDGGGSVVFNNVTTSTAFNINGTTYKISGSKLK